jgi:two-component system LytT family response regulator
MRALLVDDERLACARLRKLLARHPEIEVVAEADSVDAAEAAVAAHQPDAIFLDVEMPGGSGFELLARRRIDASVVFVTAYDQHAIAAFEANALDYLLKPVRPERLATTVARLRERRGPGERICVNDGGITRVLALDEIVLVSAERDYCELLLKNGTTLLVKLPLQRWEARLGARFLRIHRSHLVQLAEVVRLERSEGSSFRLFLRGRAHPVPVSRVHAVQLKAALARM